MHWLNLIILLYIIPIPLVAQDVIYNLGNWKHTHLNGSISMNGLYRNQENILRSGRTEKPQTKQFNSEFTLRSKSYIWHPSFMKLNIDMAYNPAVNNESFLVMPNRSETRTAEQLRLQTLFFDQRTVSLNFFTDLSHSYINREYTSSVKSYRNDYGAGLSLRNEYVPLSLKYLKSDWEQTEISNNRKYDTKRENLKLEINNSLGEGNKNQLSYNYDDALRVYGFAGRIKNYTHSIRMSNRFQFNKQNNWNSLFSFRNQRGHQSLERWQIVQNGRFYLQHNITTNFHYRFNDYKQKTRTNQQHNISGSIEHQLYLSLNSRAFFEYIDISQNSYNDYINRGGIAFNYQKKIPGGLLKLGYEYIKRNDQRNAEDGSRIITAETQQLSDDLAIFLDNPYPDQETVMVWDENRVFMYEENIDYLLLPRDNYLEIQRLPGGNISNDQTVSIDYRITQINSYDYNSTLNAFSARINLFGRLLENYFRLHNRDYDHVNVSDTRILKTINRQTYGIRVNWRYFSTGWEYDDYESNIVPYTSIRYYLNYSHTLFRSLDIYLNGSWRERKLIFDDEIQSFADISGRFGYSITRNTKISLNGGYRIQQGRGIDLDLSNMRTEVIYRIRKIYLSSGFELYRRDFSGEIIKYQGGFLRVERKF